MRRKLPERQLVLVGREKNARSLQSFCLSTLRAMALSTAVFEARAVRVGQKA